MAGLIGLLLVVAALYLLWSGALSTKEGAKEGSKEGASNNATKTEETSPLREERFTPADTGSTGVEAIRRTRDVVDQIQAHGEESEALP